MVINTCRNGGDSPTNATYIYQGVVTAEVHPSTLSNRAIEAFPAIVGYNHTAVSAKAVHNRDPDLPRFYLAYSAIPRNSRILSYNYTEYLKVNSAITATACITRCSDQVPSQLAATIFCGLYSVFSLMFIQ